jgi:hypothetical protein
MSINGLFDLTRSSDQTDGHYSARKELKVISFLIVFGAIVSALTLEFWQGEDVGIFISEVTLLERGHRLYTEIYEIKDPLFLFSSTLAYALIGLEGPFILDAVAIALTAPIGYVAARTLGFSRVSSMFGTVFLTGSISGSYFQSFRSGTIALLLILVGYIFSARQKWMVFGLISVSIIGFKMSYALFLIGPMLLMFKGDKRLQNFSRYVASIAASIFVFLIVLLSRGELSGYYSMVISNFEYRSSYPEIVGLPVGLMGHISMVNSYGSNFLLLTLVFFIQIFSSIKLVGQDVKIQSYSLCFFAFACLLTLAISAMWPHHLQILSLFAWSVGIILSQSILEYIHSPNSGVALLVVPLMLLTVLTGWKLPTGFKDSLVHPEWQTPPEAAYVANYPSLFKEQTKFARLGPNDDLGLVAFLPESWRLVCRDYSTIGIEGLERISEITNCIRNSPDVVIVSPGFIELTRPKGNYEVLKRDAMNVLQTDFSCQQLEERPGALICIRESKQ